MSDLTKLKISRMLYSIVLWIPIAVLYFQYRGFSLSLLYIVVSGQALLQVILEYPTGIIGDYFGHKLSVFLGYLFTGLGLIVLSLNSTINIYIVSLMLLSLGGALVSGSDTALLFSISKDFKKDSAWISSFGGIVFSLSLVIGAIIASWNLPITLLLSGLTTFIGSFFVLAIKNKSLDRKEGDNIFSTAKRGLIEVISNNKINFMIFSSSVLLMYYISQKWITTPVFERASIPIGLFGLLYAALTLVKSLAGFFYRKFGNLNIYLLLGSFILSCALLSIKIISIPALFFVFFLVGYYQIQSDVIISEHVDASVRASALSFRNLLNKLLESGFMAIIGSLLLKYTFPQTNYIATGIVFLLILCCFLISRIAQQSRSINITKKIQEG